MAFAASRPYTMPLRRTPERSLETESTILEGETMQRSTVVILVLAVLGCGDRSLDRLTSAEAATTAVYSFEQVPPNIPGNPGRPGGFVRGTGTPGLMPVWTSSTSLGDSPIKIDASGNVILRPGSALFIVSADGSSCWRITGESITKVAPCPSF